MLPLWVHHRAVSHRNPDSVSIPYDPESAGEALTTRPRRRKAPMRLTWTRTRIIGAVTAVLLVAGTGAVWALTRSDSSRPEAHPIVTTTTVAPTTTIPTTAPPPPTTQPAPPPPPAPPMNPIPQNGGGDHDGDNVGGPNDGDGHM
jgi:hypothetical protein